MTSVYLVPAMNFAGLMALTAITFAVGRRMLSDNQSLQLVLGGILSVGAVVVSLQPIMIINGIQIDPRNLFVGCAGAFGGPIAAIIAFSMAAATRYVEGSASASVCVLSLLVATCAGLAWRHLTQNSGKIEQKHLLGLGLAISVSYVCTFMLPREFWLPVFSAAVPFLVVINIVGAMVLGGFLESERRRDQRERHLHDQASVDPLTGLMNRRAFEASYLSTVPSCGSAGTACILIDLDHFKRVNDTYGHAVGDRVLVAVAKMLRTSIRDTDLTARFGGEEFAVCLPATDRQQTARIVERLLTAISEVGDREFDFRFTVTGSVGVCWTEMPISMRTAFEVADSALYRAKANGRNQVVFGDRPAPLQNPVPSVPLSRIGPQVVAS